MLKDETCVMDGEHFFVRGNLTLPVVDRSDPFVWGVWTSLSRASFDRMIMRWDDPGREEDPSFFGWLSSELSHVYGLSTLNLKLQVHTQPVGVRPTLELEPTQHPLAREQRNGIHWARVEQIAEMLHHGPIPSAEQAQEKVCRSAGVERVPLAEEGRIAVAKTLEGWRFPLNGMRRAPQGDMTGWYLYEGDEFPTGSGAFQVIHASHLREVCPHAVAFLGLPAGWRFRATREEYDAWYDEKVLEL